MAEFAIELEDDDDLNYTELESKWIETRVGDRFRMKDIQSQTNLLVRNPIPGVTGVVDSDDKVCGCDAITLRQLNMFKVGDHLFRHRVQGNGNHGIPSAFIIVGRNGKFLSFSLC